MEEAGGITSCQGIGGGVLSVTDRVVRHVSHSSDNACQMSATFTPAAHGNDNCKVSYPPLVCEVDVSVALAATGTCDGVVLVS